jgi:hypothetical protein
LITVNGGRILNGCLPPVLSTSIPDRVPEIISPATGTTAAAHPRPARRGGRERDGLPVMRRRHQSPGRSMILSGMEKWKAQNAFHFPTPSTATGTYLPLRYTNNSIGTNCRAGHILMALLLTRIWQLTTSTWNG